MQLFVSKTGTRVYATLLKPILFKQQPDLVHRRLLRLGSLVQRWPLVLHILKGMWAYDNTARLQQEIVGIQFRNPVGLSAGFDKNFELLPLMKAVGFGFMEGGSLTLQASDGNPRPWFYRLPKTKSLVVHVGLANRGVEQIIKTVLGYRTVTFDGFPLNISVAKTNSKAAASEADAVADYIGSLRHIQQSGIGKVITLNISCPNTYGGEPFTTPRRLEHLLSEVDKLELAQPVFIKMPINLPWPDFDMLLAVILLHRVAGVTIGNLAKDRTAIQPEDSLPPSAEGGLSGKPTWIISNNLIQNTYNKYGTRLVIIGVGGIFSADDAYKKIKLGASLVELITGMIFEGPQLIGQINNDLVRLLETDGYQNISQAIGVEA